MNDLRMAFRQLVKSPVFSIVALLSLAVGIGANTAIFSLVNDFLLRSLPVRNPDELVLLRNINGPGGRMSRAGENNGSIDPVTGREASTSFSLLAFERMRAQPSALSALFAFAPFSQVNILVDGQPETTATAQMVSGNYHTALGVAPAIGRTLTVDDDLASAPAVAVISYRYWERRFGRHPDIVGKLIAINRVPAAIVGVTAKGFDGTMQAGESPDVSVAIAHYLRFQPDRSARAQPSYWWIRVMGRLAPGATPAQAAASLEPSFQEAAREGWLAGRSATRLPDEGMPSLPTLAADPGARGENDVRRLYAGSLRMLMGLVSLLLAAACANVANLLVARGTLRRREIAVRLALGASRTRIVRQLLAESLVLACAGAALGVLLAWWSRDLLMALRPFGNTTVVLDLPLDTRVLAFTVAVTVGTAMLFGLSPALRATRVDLNAAFQSGARTLGSGGRSRLSRGLMVVQIALSLVLLVSTGLFVRTLSNLQRVDAGFNRHGLVLFRIDAASAGYTRDQFTGLQARLQQRLEQLPGVRAATFSSTPLLSRVRQNKRIAVPGHTPASTAPPIVNTNGLALNFFKTMELPLLLGREFTEQDGGSAPKVAIVNQAFVRASFDGENPIGRSIVIPGYGDRVEVIGVASDARYTDLRSATPPTVYFPSLQQVDGNANFALRLAARQNEGAVFSAIRLAVREIDPALPVLNLRTQDEQIERLNGQELLFAKLSGLFGGMALLLACVGLYGLMSHAVLRRTGEIGLRMALGAVPGHVLRMILRESLTLVCLGIAAGFSAAFSAGRLVAAMLYDLSPADPFTYSAAEIVLTGVALLASMLPALRASRIDPVAALKIE
jgi:predicted permease